MGLYSAIRFSKAYFSSLGITIVKLGGAAKSAGGKHVGRR